MTERWLPIPGWEGIYEVSDHGNVRSVDRRTTIIFNGRPITRAVKGRPMVTGSSGGRTPYPHVTLNGGTGRRDASAKVHQLVMRAFVGPRPEGTVVRHLNGDTTDNRLENLSYGTVSENGLDCVAHGNHYNTRKTHCIHNHPLSGDNLLVSGGVRRCRECRRISKARHLNSRTNAGATSSRAVEEAPAEGVAPPPPSAGVLNTPEI